MIIDIARQIALKKYSGSFEFEYACPEDLVILPSARIAGKVKVSGKYEIYDDDSVGVELIISYLLEVSVRIASSLLRSRWTIRQTYFFLPRTTAKIIRITALNSISRLP